MDFEYSNEESKSSESTGRRSDSVSSSGEPLSSEKESLHLTNKEDGLYDEDHEAKIFRNAKSTTSYSIWMKRIAISQMLIAAACIIISIPLMVEIHRSSVGSGIWCSVFFAVVGGLNYTAERMDRGFIALTTFGATCMYFGVIMFVIEVIELVTVLKERPQHLEAPILHAALSLLAALEILLAIVALVLCNKKKNNPKTSSSKNQQSAATKTIISTLIEGL